MIAGILIGKLCIIAAVVAVALILEVVVPILRLKRMEKMLTEGNEGEKLDGGGEVSSFRFQVSSSKFQVSSSKFQVSGDGFQVSGDGLQVGGVEGEKLWAEACGMTPSEVPSFETDWQYMTLVHKAAELGHLEAMSRLGDYAFRRGDLVEAFYWKLRVEMGGGSCRNPSLMDIVDAWVEVGSPDGGEDVGPGLSEPQADFAHAVLCLKSRVDPRFGTMRLKELFDADDEDAKRFLKRRSIGLG